MSTMDAIDEKLRHDLNGHSTHVDARRTSIEEGQIMDYVVVDQRGDDLPEVYGLFGDYEEAEQFIEVHLGGACDEIDALPLQASTLRGGKL